MSLQFYPHVLIIEARFYHQIADGLKEGAIATLERERATHDVISVPGALELPTALSYVLYAEEMQKGRKKYDGFILLGCVVRGETSHYDHVCTESIRLVQDLAVKHQLAVGNGILTVENKDQAWDRALVNKKDKGGSAAKACLEMIELRRQFNVGYPE